MKHTLQTFLLSACAGVLWITTCAAAPTNLTVATWNVENLFDVEDDPENPADEEFLPTSWRRWTERRYRLKLEHLAWVIAEMKPDVQCFQEVENRRVLEDLTEVLRRTHELDYSQIVHREGHDHRGIDVAAISRVPVLSTNWLAPVAEQRDMLILTVAVDAAPVTIVVNHWKSWYGKRAENIAIRAAQAQAMRTAIDGLFAVDPQMALLVLGDFNDNVDAATMVTIARMSPDREMVMNAPDTQILYNLSGGIPEETRGSLFYARLGVWNSFDSINVSAGMLGRKDVAAPWRVREESYRVFRPESIRDAEGRPRPFRRIRRKGGVDYYEEGYSDHFPVVVTLTRQTD